MNAIRTALSILFRLSGVTLLVLGIILWTGRGAQLLQLHMGLGVLFTLTYLAIVALASRDGLALGPSLLAAAWGFVIPTFGMMQTRLLPGPGHWIIRVTHLLIAVVAMRVADKLLRGNPMRRSGETAAMPDGVKA